MVMSKMVIYKAYLYICYLNFCSTASALIAGLCLTQSQRMAFSQGDNVLIDFQESMCSAINQCAQIVHMRSHTSGSNYHDIDPLLTTTPRWFCGYPFTNNSVWGEDYDDG